MSEKKLSKNLAPDVVGVVGVASLFGGLLLQFGVAISLIVLGSLFICVSIAAALRG